jgi:hypothetical protein
MVRLLLDYNARPSQLSRFPASSLNVVALDEATRCGILCTAIVRLRPLLLAMLLAAWTDDALTDGEFALALLVAAQAGSRDCMAVLLHGQQQKALLYLRSRSVIRRAMRSDSTLVPLLAAYGMMAGPPPADVKSHSVWSKLLQASRIGETVVTFSRIEEELRKLVFPWRKPALAEAEEGEIDAW